MTLEGLTKLFVVTRTIDVYMLKKALIVVGVLIVFVILVGQPFLANYGASTDLPDNGEVPKPPWTDVQGTISMHIPSQHWNAPQNVVFHAYPGDNGHVSWGMFGVNGVGDYSQVGVTLELNDVDYVDDGWMMRIAIATSWIDDNGKYHYLEFDVWDSPETDKKIPWLNVLNYDKFDSEMPTVNVKCYQMEEEEKRSFYIDARKHFDRIFDVEAELFGVYLVIEKTHAEGELFADLKIHDMVVYR